MTADKIYLVGFMGAGKTTLGAALATRLGWLLIDVDREIEQREHRTVADIFTTSGEPYFRAVERAVVRDLLPVRHAVVATGGGTFVDPESRALMTVDGRCVWLDVPLAAAIDRLPADGSRPLAVDRHGFEALFTARQAAYCQAHLRLDASRPTPELVECVLEQLDW